MKVTSAASTLPQQKGRCNNMDELIRLQLQKTACRVRMGIIEGVYNAKSGHPGGSLSIADLLTYLYSVMNVDPKNPDMPERDRLVLSKGHTAPALYSVLAERGFFPKEELKSLRHIGALLQGHPCIHIPGVDMSSGSLGQGISTAVGMALSGKHRSQDYRVYTILGDGEIEEGQVWEAAMYAAAKKLRCSLHTTDWTISSQSLTTTVSRSTEKLPMSAPPNPLPINSLRSAGT